jgi:hypothetical protein
MSLDEIAREMGEEGVALPPNLRAPRMLGLIIRCNTDIEHALSTQIVGAGHLGMHHRTKAVLKLRLVLDQNGNAGLRVLVALESREVKRPRKFWIPVLGAFRRFSFAIVERTTIVAP